LALRSSAPRARQYIPGSTRYAARLASGSERASAPIARRIVAAPPRRGGGGVCGGAARGVRAVAWLGYRCVAAPDVAFLVGSGWLTNPRPVDAKVQQYGQAHVPVATFVQRFELETAPPAATLHVEA